MPLFLKGILFAFLRLFGYIALEYALNLIIKEIQHRLKIDGVQVDDVLMDMTKKRILSQYNSDFIRNSVKTKKYKPIVREGMATYKNLLKSLEPHEK